MQLSNVDEALGLRRRRRAVGCPEEPRTFREAIRRTDKDQPIARLGSEVTGRTRDRVLAAPDSQYRQAIFSSEFQLRQRLPSGRGARPNCNRSGVKAFLVQSLQHHEVRLLNGAPKNAVVLGP